MDDLIIKDALIEEAAEAPFPADAWERQKSLLADSGLFGSVSEPVRLARPNQSRLLLEMVAVAAVLLLAVGLGLQVRPTRDEVAQGGAPVAAGGSASEAPHVEDVSDQAWRAQVEESINQVKERVAQSKERMAGLQREMERLLLTSYWSITPHQVSGIEPIPGLPNRPIGDRPTRDTRLDLMLSKLLGWLHRAQLIEEAVPAEEVMETYLYLNLEGGDRIRFARHVSCRTSVDSDCPFVVSGTGRPTVLIEQPELWRWLSGRIWDQDLGITDMPATGRNHLTEATPDRRLEVERQMLADPDVQQFGFELNNVELVPRYEQHQEADGSWRITDHPTWVVQLGRPAPGTLGETRMYDDATGELIWKVTTTLQRP